MEYFVQKDSIVRQIWGKSDTILFIFAGAAAEFALNKAVDWLYYTGKLPADPLGRLFSTVEYARMIVFADKESANRAIARINQIHGSVESSRNEKIPDWAYRDVLFMLIDYSISAYELLERPLTKNEKTEVFKVFNAMGLGMNITGLPSNYDEYTIARANQLETNLLHSQFTTDLYKQYQKNLGLFRYYLLLKVQAVLAPRRVRQLLHFRFPKSILPVIWLYKISRLVNLDELFKAMLLPADYKAQIKELDMIKSL